MEQCTRFIHNNITDWSTAYPWTVAILGLGGGGGGVFQSHLGNLKYACRLVCTHKMSEVLFQDIKEVTRSFLLQ